MDPRWTRRLAGLFLVASAGLVFVMLRRPSILFLVASAAIGSAAYLYIGNKIPTHETAEDAIVISDVTRRRINLLAGAAFFLLSAWSLLELRSYAYAKTATYYLLVAAAGATVALRIGLVEKGRGVLANLGLIVLLALNIFGSDQLAFPLGLGGADSATHLQFLVYPIVRTGFIPPTNECGFVYGTFPAHHILVASTSLLTAVEPSTAYYTMGFLVMVLPVLVVFLVGRALLGDRAGLLASLLLTGSSYYIFWASHASTLSFAIPLISILMFTLLKSIMRPSRRLFFVMAVLTLALVLTHPYSSVVFGFVLLVLLVGLRIVRRGPAPWVWGPRILGVAFSYTVLIYWSNYTCLMTKSFQLASGYASALTNDPIATTTPIYDALPLLTIFVNTLGDSLLQILVVIGFFLVLSRRVSPRHILVIGPTIGLLLLAALGLVSRLNYLLPNRVYVFLQVLGLAPLAAVCLRDFARWRPAAGSPRRTLAVVALTAVLVGSFTFASSTSTIAGFETSPFVGEQPYVKLYATVYDVHAAAWICGTFSRGAAIDVSQSVFGLARYAVRGCVETENRSVDYLPYFTPEVFGLEGRIDVDRIKPGSFVWYSAYDTKPGYQGDLLAIGQTGRALIARLDPKAVDALADFDRLYDNGPMEIYYVPGGP